MYPLPKQFQLSSLPQFYFCVDICNCALKKTSMKKNVFFRALPESPKPQPPPDPNSGNLVLFFRKSKFKI